MLSIREVANQFNFTPATIRNWIRRGVYRAGRVILLPATRIGGQWRCVPGDVDQFVRAIAETRKPIGQRREMRRAERAARLILG